MKKINATIIFSSFYILGVISFFTKTIPYFAVFLAAALIFSLYKNFISNRAAIIFYFAFAIALLNCNFQIKNFDDLSKFIPSQGTITGTVETIPTTNSTGKTKFYLKVHKAVLKQNDKEKADYSNAMNARTIVTIYDTAENLSKIRIADKLELKGKLRNPSYAKNPSQFDYSNYLKNHDTFSTFYVNQGNWKIISEPDNVYGKFLQKLNDKRGQILDIHRKYIKSPNIEVLGGIVFGDDAINPPEDVKNSFINSGLLHILAASGMNVSIIFGIWFFIGIKLRLDFRLVVVVGAILVGFYTLMTGMGPSVLRAALMIEFVLFGKLINRNADSIALVFFVAFLMLLYNPAMINDVGFQLSFVVTFALMFYCPPLLEKMDNKIVEFFAGAVLIPFVAQLFAAPIQMFYFNTFATYSIFANFVITPFIMIISFLGFAASIIAMLPLGLAAEKICMFFDIILNPFVGMLVEISRWFAQLPGSLLYTIHPSHFQLILYYAILIGIGFLIRNYFRNKKFIILISIMLLLFGVSFVKINNQTCEVIIFDVGNADSFLIKSPDKKYIMIDTAHGRLENSKSSFSQADAIMGKYLRDNGIKCLDLLILTHFDSDHSGGAVDIMRNVKVKKLVLNKYKDNSKTTNALMAYINEYSINTEHAGNNETLIKEKNFTVKTYTPDFKYSSNDNENSIITLISYGEFDMLFMGDAGVQSFEKIENDIKNNKIEVLKSGHHGAKNTVSKKMLKQINPDVAVISTGYNTYGHPAKQTLKMLSSNGIKIYRTDSNNAMKIVSSGNKYRLYKYETASKKFVFDFEENLRSAPAR